MKIIEETSTRLVVQHQPITQWFTGGCFLIGSLIFLIYQLLFEPVSIKLACTRPVSTQTNCELKRFKLLGIGKTVKILNPQAARIITKSGSKKAKYYHVVIITKLGEFELLHHHNYQENLEISTKINNFINSKETLLLLQQNQQQYLISLSSVMLILSGIGMFLLTTPVTNCTFYRSLHQVIIERKGLRTNKTIERQLKEIHRVYVDEKTYKGQKRYRAVIIFKSSEELPINRQYVKNFQNIFYVVNRINTFIAADK